VVLRPGKKNYADGEEKKSEREKKSRSHPHPGVGDHRFVHSQITPRGCLHTVGIKKYETIKKNTKRGETGNRAYIEHHAPTLAQFKRNDRPFLPKSRGVEKTEGGTYS